MLTSDADCTLIWNPKAKTVSKKFLIGTVKRREKHLTNILSHNIQFAKLTNQASILREIPKKSQP